MSGGLLDRTLGVLFRQSGDSETGYANSVSWERREGEDSEFDAVRGVIEGEVCAFRTADGTQVTGPCLIVGYVVTTATASGPIEVEDGLSAGTGSDKFHIPASTGVGVYHFGGVGIKCLTGAYLNYVGATGTVALIVQLAAGSTIEA